MMQCGMEVVLPDGELVRTGNGALPGNNTCAAIAATEEITGWK